MNLNIDLKNISVTEFGVGRDDGDEPNFVLVPVDADVQKALIEMVEVTWEEMQGDEEGPKKYEPSEKYSSIEYLYLPITDELASSVTELHQAKNQETNSGALENPNNVFCYFVRLTDKNNHHLTAVRRASQFKGVLKKRLIRITTDSLKLIEDDVFKLDSDFDFMIDSQKVHILRPSGFEFAGKLQEAVLSAVPQNIKAIQKELAFVQLDHIQEYASKHPRAAKYLASIKSLGETKNIDKRALKGLCKETNVEIKELKGKIIIQDGHEMGFLEVLDRRRYALSLVKGSTEKFIAGSRRKLDGRGA